MISCSLWCAVLTGHVHRVLVLHVVSDSVEGHYFVYLTVQSRKHVLCAFSLCGKDFLPPPIVCYYHLHACHYHKSHICPAVSPGGSNYLLASVSYVPSRHASLADS